MTDFAVIGSGPAGLMAAEVLSQAGHRVKIFEKRNGIARKIFIAGSSGLNISNNLPMDEFVQQYQPQNQTITSALRSFDTQCWLAFIKDLGLDTFEGTSGRYFVKPMNGLKLVRAWRKRLGDRGVEFVLNAECKGVTSSEGRVTLTFTDGSEESFRAVCFALGGASYEPEEYPLRWPKIFDAHNVAFEDFAASNVGYQIAWKEAFLDEAEGLALKNINFRSARGEKRGDLVITKYGIEGTPVYTLGTPGTAYLDLKPDMSFEQIVSRCESSKENLSPMRRVKKFLNLTPAALALLFHHAPVASLDNLSDLARLIKAFPLDLVASQNLEEAISSSGGISLDEITEGFMLRKIPGVYCAGEMLAWDAPTGGFLIQGSIAQGYAAACAMLA